MQRTSCALLALVALPLFAADVYRSVDENGNIVYSDRPQGANPELVRVLSQRHASPPPSAENANPPPVAASTAERPRRGSEAPPEPVEPTAEEIAEKCAQARDRARRYNESYRLYRTLPNGERDYLEDAEIDEARARAAADVDTWCR